MNGPVRQIAWFVPDAAAAAARHATLFGSGPYFLAEHIELSVCRHRGRPAVLDHTSAYGWWGEVMLEFVQQNSPEPSVFTDLFPKGGPGVHHLALIVDDLSVALAEFNAAGFETALYAETVAGGLAFAMVDTVAEQGVFTELYEPAPPLTALYSAVRRAHENPDGGQTVRPMRALVAVG